jgi:hypothetical protein
MNNNTQPVDNGRPSIKPQKLVVENMTAKQARDILSDMAKGIKPQEADIIKIVGDYMITGKIRAVVYDCRNTNGDYYWLNVCKDGVIVREMVSISLPEICRSMNLWMRKNKL